MKLTMLVEMAAKKICPDCGKSMAGYHYWYKGGWKCKKSSTEPAPTDQLQAPVAATPTSVPPATPEPTIPAKIEPQSIIGKQALQANTPPEQSVSVEQQSLEITLDIIDDAKPLLDTEIAKVNKTAAKVGAEPIVVTVEKQYLKDVERRDPDDPARKIKYKVKMLTIKLVGSTPRIKAADGSTWNFIGVITPSSSGKALLKLTPSAGDTEGLRRLYSTDPYYCDYCKKVRMRNETFIVQNGDNYKQVGRNCLKDFVGGVNPQALLAFFAWFADPEDLQRRLDGVGSQSNGEGGYGGRGNQYYTPLEILEATMAVVRYRKSYVSSKTENGMSTASNVRKLLNPPRWDRYTSDSEKQDHSAMQSLREDETVKTEATKVLDWFNALPQKQKDENTFFKNIEVMVADDAVESKQVGYIVGLYPAYQRAEQGNAEKKTGVTLIKEWPAEWGNDSRPIVEQHAVVNFVKYVQGQYGTSQLILVMFDDGVSAAWKYSGNMDVEKGDELTMTGTLEKETYFDPPRIKFVADRKWLRGSFKQQIDAMAEKGNE